MNDNNCLTFFQRVHGTRQSECLGTRNFLEILVECGARVQPNPARVDKRPAIGERAGWWGYVVGCIGVSWVIAGSCVWNDENG